MSEHIQLTSAHNLEKMKKRYGDIPHKHNKCHNFKRYHQKSHPIEIVAITPPPLGVHISLGLVHLENIKKYFKPHLAQNQRH